MEITDIETILLTGPCTLDPYLSEARKLRSVSLIRIKTNSGLTGIGETYAGYFFPEGIKAIVDFFKPILVGATIEDIPELWRKMYHCGNFWCRVGLGASVLTGIEAALWDLKGKLLGLPVYKLLKDSWEDKFRLINNDGRKLFYQSKIPCYATGGPSNYPIDKLARKIELYLSLGFHGVKIGVGSYTKDRGLNISNDPLLASDTEASKARFIRENFGHDMWLMIDAHMGNSPVVWSFETAIAVINALEQFNLLFLEEPLPYSQPDQYAKLAACSSIEIAGGECLTALSEWEAFINHNCFNIGQPDASFTSGLDAFMQVAVWLAAHDRTLATHSWGAGASLMQNVHCGFACPNAKILEIAPNYGPLHSELIGDSLKINDGFVLPPENPGLGITLTEDTIRRFPFIPGSGEFNSVPPNKVLTT